ncbi:TSUP family transporter [uncultured Thiodictyon sp.]|uniref:TSUP family transporter n=1 Tax=uncultured Thiodictyon sp. TaxID=1846217 RepID=UPI0025D5B6F7|nr:TSUP family transporter [uncultured Thiodictyon sp.]
MVSIDLLGLLFLVALLAGFVDAIAGGGGLICIPALLWAGLGPVATLATNKAQAVFGSGTAALNFIHKGQIELRAAAFAALCTFGGATAGALLVRQLDSAFLGRLIPVFLIGFALYFLFSPRASDLDSRRRLGATPFALTVGLGLGFYDGFFGPGTGTFFAMGYVALQGYHLRRATAHSKLLNVASNLAALLVFLPSGQIAWPMALVMGAGQLLGAWLGSHLVLRHGTALVRPVLVVSSLLVSAKLLLDQLR